MSANLFEDMMELEPFAAHVQRTQRTVRRWLDEPNGLPYTKLGNRILIHLPTAREWILARMQNVGRERPRKSIRHGSRRRRAVEKQSEQQQI